MYIHIHRVTYLVTLTLRTWRFMGSYKWGYKSADMGYSLLISPLP